MTGSDGSCAATQASKLANQLATGVIAVDAGWPSINDRSVTSTGPFQSVSGCSNSTCVRVAHAPPNDDGVIIDLRDEGDPDCTRPHRTSVDGGFRPSPTSA